MKNKKFVVLFVVVISLLVVLVVVSCTRTLPIFPMIAEIFTTAPEQPITENTTATPTGTCRPMSSPTDTPEPTPTPTYLPTLTVTPTNTPVPALDQLIEIAKQQEMLVSISFSPDIEVDRFYSTVQVVEGYTPEQLVGQAYPEVWERIQAETYYKDYFRVILVGGYKGCPGDPSCDYGPVYEYRYTWMGSPRNNSYSNPPEGYELPPYRSKIEYGGVIIHWHLDKNICCTAGTFINSCIR